MNEIYEGLDNYIDFEYERETQADADATADWQQANERGENKMNKKEFQKTIAYIRKEQGSHQYPKAMMTNAQEMKDTATVNCGVEYNQIALKSADNVMGHPKFRELLEKYDSTAFIEFKGGNTQIRIRWGAR